MRRVKSGKATLVLPKDIELVKVGSDDYYILHIESDKKLLEGTREECIEFRNKYE